MQAESLTKNPTTTMKVNVGSVLSCLEQQLRISLEAPATPLELH